MKGNGHIYTPGEIRPGPPMAMTHSESEQREISERYVRGTLSPPERLAFEEHFFVCDECFQQVQMMERFTAGMRHAAETDKLASHVAEFRAPRLLAPWTNWLNLGFATAAIASLILTAALCWLLLYQLPRVRGQLAQERQAREQADLESRQQLKSSSERLEAERRERAKLENQLEVEKRSRSDRTSDAQRLRSDSQDRIAMVTTPQPNVPVAILEAERATDSTTTELDLPRGANSLVLWMEVESSRFESFRMQAYAGNKRLIQTVSGLKRNNEGALSVSLPIRTLPPGKYNIKLFGVGPHQIELVGSYRLSIVRPRMNR